MKRPGFSISTILLVAIMLGAVAYVGSLVNPIKPQDKAHDHEAEQSQTASNGQTPQEIGSEPIAKSDSPDRKKFIEDEARQRRQMMKQIAQQAKKQAGGGDTPVTPVKDPEAIDPNSDIFFKSEMGAEGIRKQEAEISRLKKAFDAAKAKEKKSPYGIPISPDTAKGAGQVP